MRTQRGFTLVEVVVAIGIFAVLGLGCYKVVHGLSVARDTMTKHSEEMRKLARMINTLNADFSQLTPRMIMDASGRRFAALDTHGDYPVEFSRVGVSNPLLQKRAKVARVAYRFEKELTLDDFQLDDSVPKQNASLREAIGDGKQGYLVRYTWPVLDRGNDDKPQMQVVMADVNGLEITFMDDKQNWGEEWPVLGSPSGLDLPYAIHLKIDTKKYGVLERTYQIRSLPLLPQT